MNEEKVLDAFSDLEGILMDDKEGLEALEVIQEALESSKTVYIVEDYKHGVQAVFANQDAANKDCETGKHDISGAGAYVVEFEVE